LTPTDDQVAPPGPSDGAVEDEQLCRHIENEDLGCHVRREVSDFLQLLRQTLEDDFRAAIEDGTGGAGSVDLLDPAWVRARSWTQSSPARWLLPMSGTRDQRRASCD